MQVIDYLVQQLRECGQFNSASQVAPAVVLWTDESRQWQSAMPVIKRYLPELLELGNYQPELKTGPAIWIKCVIAGTLSDVSFPEGLTPILYLPGVGRKDLRAIAQCPTWLQPLAELQYRGCWWAYNTAGRDWTVSSFLTNPKVGLALDVAKDTRAQSALLSVLPDLLESQADILRGKRIETADLLALSGGDPIKNLLAWLEDPEGCETEWREEGHWQHFVDQCADSFGVDLAKMEYQLLLQLLCEGAGLWESVWQRFVDTAQHHPRLIKAMMSVQPTDLLFEPSHYCSENAREEATLAQQLQTLATEPSSQLRQQLEALNKKHAERREWLWASLGLSAWVKVLKPLQQISEMTKQQPGGPSVESLAELYQQKLWAVDAAALEAMALSTDSSMQQCVAALLAQMYTPWLEALTLRFQQLVREEGYPGLRGIQEPPARYQVDNTAFFFVDGLRFDLAHRLQEKLKQASLSSSLDTRWSALPSLTATAKAAVTPLSELLEGEIDNDDFVPVFMDGRTSFSSHHFKKSLAKLGWQYLEGLDCGDPAQGHAWLQTGDIDNLGHERQQNLPQAIESVLNTVVERVAGLFAAGWRKVVIVTDHGWLWAPERLPKSDIDKFVTEKRLARCAILKGNVQTDTLKMPWYWNPNVTLAMAPGISVFTAGDYYNHGGLSLQECLTPVVHVIAE